MRRALAFSIVLKAALSASGASAETLKVAVAQRGFWNSSFIEFGIKQGFFKETGLDETEKRPPAPRMRVSSKNSKANRIETGERSGGIGEICSVEVEEK